jgi:hypothetical protein
MSRQVLVSQNFKMSSGPFPTANSNLSSSVMLALLIKFLSYCYHIPLHHPSLPVIISVSTCHHIPLRHLSPPAIISLYTCYHIPLHLLSYPSPPAIISLSNCYHIPLLLLSLPSSYPLHATCIPPLLITLSLYSNSATYIPLLLLHLYPSPLATFFPLYSSSPATCIPLL